MSEKRITPEGKYPAVLVPMGGDDGIHLLRFAKAGSGNPQCLGYFKIVEGPEAGEIVPWFGALTKDSYERTMKSWRYCGWKGKDISKPGPMDQVVEIEVEHNTWEGKTNARVAWVNPAGGGSIKLANPLVGNDLAKLVARLNSNAARIDEIDGERFDRSKPVQKAKQSADEHSETRVERDAPADDWNSGPARGNGKAAEPSWGSEPWNEPGAQGGPRSDDDIPFITVNIGADRLERRWSRWP